MEDYQQVTGQIEAISGGDCDVHPLGELGLSLGFCLGFSLGFRSGFSFGFSLEFISLGFSLIRVEVARALEAGLHFDFVDTQNMRNPMWSSHEVAGCGVLRVSDFSGPKGSPCTPYTPTSNPKPLNP